MLKSLLNKFIPSVFPLLNPFVNDDINHMGDVSGINTVTVREHKILVSLTSYKDRYNDLPKTLYSLFHQSLKPDKIILWLGNETNDLTTLPYEITRFIKNGLEIRFVQDIKSYTKAIYAFKEYGNYIIVTADDDVYYKKNWLRKLYLSYISNPEDIHVHRAHRVLTDTRKKIIPYEKWHKHVNEESARFDNFLTGVGGVLYPPNCFTHEVLRSDIFLKYAPNADDIWFWIMALIHNRKIRVVKNHYKKLICVNILSHIFKSGLYKKNKLGGNDTQLNDLMTLYGQNVFNKLNSEIDQI